MMRRGLPVLCIVLSARTALAWVPLQECAPGELSHWASTPVSYMLNDNGSSDLTFGQVKSIFAAAWATWDAVCCATWSTTYGGPTPEIANADNVEHVISFEETAWPPALGDPGSTLAITMFQYGGGCTLVDADILFNGAGFTWVDGAPAASGEIDLQSVATHEEGHWVGLGHSAVPTSTLFPTYDGGIATRVLDPDDIAGACTLYRATELDCFDNADEDCDGDTDCADVDCGAEPACTCTATAALTCENVTNGDSGSGVQNLDSYPCSPAIDDSGPEVAYSFAPSFNGTVTLDLTNFGAADLNLMVMGVGCNPAFCSVASAQSSGVAEQVVLDVTGSTTYYIVVDGPGAGGATFDLGLSCVRVSEAWCDNGADDDLDSSTDCDDADCDGMTCQPGGATCSGALCVCPGGQSNESTCDDGLDNDCDGSLDCGDGDCDGAACDADGRTCFGNACQCPGGVTAELTCDDGQDNDCDGDGDCDDADCFGKTCGPNGRQCVFAATGSVCLCPLGQSYELACFDLNDNDCDGAIDCDDSDCEGKLCNNTGSLCVSGTCTCVVAPGQAAESTCDDGNDNDCDGLIDCDDPNCVLSGTEQSFCGDSLDNDCDGDIDCNDSDCAGHGLCPPATETNCTDGVDEDLDSATDCADSDCAADPACALGDGNPGGDANPQGDMYGGPAGDADTRGSPGGCDCHAGDGAGNGVSVALLLLALMSRRRRRA